MQSLWASARRGLSAVGRPCARQPQASPPADDGLRAPVPFAPLEADDEEVGALLREGADVEVPFGPREANALFWKSESIQVVHQLSEGASGDAGLPETFIASTIVGLEEPTLLLDASAQEPTVYLDGPPQDQDATVYPDASDRGGPRPHGASASTLLACESFSELPALSKAEEGTAGAVRMNQALGLDARRCCVKQGSPPGLSIALAASWRRPATAVLLGSLVVAGVVALASGGPRRSPEAEVSTDVMVANARPLGHFSTTTTTTSAVTTTTTTTAAAASGTANSFVLLINHGHLVDEVTITSTTTVTLTSISPARSSSTATDVAASSTTATVVSATQTPSMRTATGSGSWTTSGTTTGIPARTTIQDEVLTTIQDDVLDDVQDDDSDLSAVNSALLGAPRLGSNSTAEAIAPLTLGIGFPLMSQAAQSALDTTAASATPAPWGGRMTSSPTPAPTAEPPTPAPTAAPPTPAPTAALATPAPTAAPATPAPTAALATPAPTAAPATPGEAHLVAGASAGDTVIHVDLADGFSTGDEIEIAGGGFSERRVILDFGSIVVDRGLEHNYSSNAKVTKTMGAKDLQELKEAADQAAQDAKKKRDAIIGGTVGGVVGVAGLVAGLAAGLTATHKPTNMTTEPPPLTWTTFTQALTTTTQEAVVLMDDAPAREGMDALGAASGHLAGPAGVQEPSQSPVLWLIISTVMIVILSVALFWFFRRKLTMAAAKGRRREQARALAGEWSPSTAGSALSQLSSPSAVSQSGLDQSALDQSALDQSALDQSSIDDLNESTLVAEVDVQDAPTCGDPRKAWDKLFDILDRDGDGRVTHEDFRHAPVAAVAVDMALQGAQQMAQPLMSQQSFGSVATQVGPPPAGYAEPLAGHFGQPPRLGQALPGQLPGPRPGQMPGLPAFAGVPGSVPGSFVPPGMAPLGTGLAPLGTGLAGVGGMASVPHPAGLRR